MADTVSRTEYEDLRRQVRELQEQVETFSDGGLERTAVRGLLVPSANSLNGAEQNGTSQRVARSDHGHRGLLAEGYFYKPGEAGGQIAYLSDTSTEEGAIYSNPSKDGQPRFGPAVFDDAEGQWGMHTTPASSAIIAPAAGAYIMADCISDEDNVAMYRIRNTNATGTGAGAQFRMQADTALGVFTAQGSGRTALRMGKSIGGMVEVITSGGNGLILGNVGNAPLIMGVANTSRYIQPVVFTPTTSAQTIATLPLPTSNTAGVVIAFVTLRTTDGTDQCLYSAIFTMSAYNKGGTVTPAVTETPLSTAITSAGGSFSTPLTGSVTTSGTNALLQMRYTNSIGTATAASLIYQILNNSSVSATAP